MMNETLSTIVIASVTSLITGLSTWFFTRRKYNAEVDGSQIDNLQKTLDFYVTLSDDTKERLNEILAQNNSLEAQVKELKEENQKFKELVEKQNAHIETLTEQIKSLNSIIAKSSKLK